MSRYPYCSRGCFCTVLTPDYIRRSVIVPLPKTPMGTTVCLHFKPLQNNECYSCVLLIDATKAFDRLKFGNVLYTPE